MQGYENHRILSTQIIIEIMKTILITIACFFLLVNCSNKSNSPKEESLWDETPQQIEATQSNGKVRLNTTISPAPPGTTDANDTTSVITPDKVSTSDKIFEVLDVDYLPEYPNGGWEAFSGYIQSLKYPRELKEEQIEGHLSVQFVIEKDGSVSNIEIIKSVDKMIDDEITKALQNMPKWKPGKKDGLYVRSKYGFTLIYGK